MGTFVAENGFIILVLHGFFSFVHYYAEPSTKKVMTRLIKVGYRDSAASGFLLVSHGKSPIGHVNVYTIQKRECRRIEIGYCCPLRRQCQKKLLCKKIIIIYLPSKTIVDIINFSVSVLYS